MTQTIPTRGARRHAAAFLLLFSIAACGYSAPASTAAPAPKATGDDEVLAQVGDMKVTMADIQAVAGPQLQQLEQRRHEIIDGALGNAIDNKLIQLEAQKQGTDQTQLLSKEVDAKIKPVTDADVDAFYEEKKAQINQPKEQIADRIRMYLQAQRQQEAKEAYVASLRGKYPVKTMFEPIRTEVAAEGPAKGPANAPVTMVIFSDFQCPFCGRVEPTLKQVEQKYGDKVRMVFRQFPLNNIHPMAQKAAEASLCAADQGKFWEMHDAMFADQSALGVDQLKATAGKIGLDAGKFAACLDGSTKAAQISADLAAGQAAGVNGTPAVFVNGRFLNGAVPFEDFARIIDDELARKAEQSAAK